MSAILAFFRPYKGRHRASVCVGCEQANNGLQRGRHCHTGNCWCC